MVNENGQKSLQWGIERVKRLQIDMREAGLFSCRGEKGFDSVCVCFPQAKADTAHDLERDLLSFPAVSALNCSVRTCLSFVDRLLQSLRANNQPSQSARHSSVRSNGVGCVPVSSS
jgi:hypothetical protein